METEVNPPWYFQFDVKENPLFIHCQWSGLKVAEIDWILQRQILRLFEFADWNLTSGQSAVDWPGVFPHAIYTSRFIQDGH